MGQAPSNNNNEKKTNSSSFFQSNNDDDDKIPKIDTFEKKENKKKNFTYIVVDNIVLGTEKDRKDSSQRIFPAKLIDLRDTLDEENTNKVHDEFRRVLDKIQINKFFPTLREAEKFCKTVIQNKDARNTIFKCESCEIDDTTEMESFYKELDVMLEEKLTILKNEKEKKLAIAANLTLKEEFKKNTLNSALKEKLQAGETFPIIIEVLGKNKKIEKVIKEIVDNKPTIEEIEKEVEEIVVVQLKPPTNVYKAKLNKF